MSATVMDALHYIMQLTEDQQFVPYCSYKKELIWRLEIYMDNARFLMQ